MSGVPNTAMVLAAGRGLRMRPLTETTPKPLVRLNGKALLDHVLDRLAEAGVGRAVVNAHHFSDQLIAHLSDRRSPTIMISDERGGLLDTGGGIVKALPLLGQAPFLIHNADSVWIDGIGSNLHRLARAFDAERMDSLLLLALGSTSVGYEGRGDFSMTATGALRRRREREVTPFVFTGVSIAHPRLFRDAPDGPFSLNLIWDRAMARARLYGLRLEGTWMHVGTLEALRACEALLARSHES
jgi:MurNAc alpha-1-phosphate uridylyltransferase